MQPALGMKARTLVRFQCSTHHCTSQWPRAAKNPRIVVWPRRMPRRYQGSCPAPVWALLEAVVAVAGVAAVAVVVVGTGVVTTEALPLWRRDWPAASRSTCVRG